MKMKGIKLKDRYPNAYRALKAEYKKRMQALSLYAWRQLRNDPQRLDKDEKGSPIFFAKMFLKENKYTCLQTVIEKYSEP